MSTGGSWVLTESSLVTPAERSEVLAVAAAAENLDRVGALDDQVRLDLELAEETLARHVVARRSDATSVVGYAHLDLRTDAATTVHVVVAPSHRRQGLGRALIRHVLDRDTRRAFQVWAHGNGVAAAALADHLELVKARELLQMGLTLKPDLAHPSYPPDVQVRAFVPGRDEAAWVDVNARAFRHHPEQGRATADDLRQRMKQPWFDPSGLFLAERDGILLGFHWTKVHPSGPGADSFGEVYVVGVDPVAQGFGLGKALTLTGLRHIYDRGLRQVALYVEGDNEPALATYTRLGFATTMVDVMYERALSMPFGER